MTERIAIMLDMASKNVPKSVRLDPELEKRLRDWIEAQPAKPDVSAVIKAALVEFLDRHADAARRKPKPS